LTGYVNVPSSLLMVVFFVQLTFTFSKVITSYILTGQSSELETLYARIAEISRLLELGRKNL